MVNNYQQISVLCPSALHSIHNIPTLTTVQFHVFNNVQTSHYFRPQVPIFNPFRSLELMSLNNFQFNSALTSLLFLLSLHSIITNFEFQPICRFRLSNSKFQLRAQRSILQCRKVLPTLAFTVLCSSTHCACFSSHELL